MNTDALDLFIQTVMDSVSINKTGLTPQNHQFRITASDSVALCREVLPIFEKEKTVIDLPSPINICGDIHGQLYDLVRCLQLGGFPPSTRWLFLGDFVDRGPCSVEVITLLFALKIRYPSHIYLIRGNHESPEMTQIFGFRDECFQKFDIQPYSIKNESQGDIVWLEFCTVFEYIPIAAIVANTYFCIHGGISPKLDKIRQIREIKRPLKIPLTGLITDLFWSDPSKDTKEYGQSERGETCVWGLAPVKRFLKENKLKCLIRGHQFVVEGFDFPFYPDKSVITMFTASNYAEGIPNKAAFLVMDKSGKYEIHPLPQFPNFLSSPQLQIANALVSLNVKDEPPPSQQNPMFVNSSEQNISNQNQSNDNQIQQHQVKVRQMINHTISQHRRSLPIEKYRHDIVATTSNSGKANVNTDDNESVNSDEKVASPNNNTKENKTPPKKCSISINPSSRSGKSKSSVSTTKPMNQNQVASPTNKNSNQNQVASPTNKNSNQNQVVNQANKNGNQSQTASPTNKNGNQNQISNPANKNGNQSQVASPTNKNGNQNQISNPANKNGNQSQVSNPANKNGNQSQVANQANKNSNQSQVASPTNKNGNQSQTASPTSRMIEVNKSNLNKRMSATKSSSNENLSATTSSIQVMQPVNSFSIPTLNIRNLNIPQNDGIDLSSLDDEISQNDEMNYRSTTVASPPNVNRINNMPSISIASIEHNNKTKKGEFSFPPPLPTPSSARSAKVNPYRQVAANSRSANEDSPLIMKKEKRKNSEPCSLNSLRTSPKSISKSAASVTPPQNQSKNTPPKPKRVPNEYVPTPRPNISKARTNKARSNSLKLSPF